MRTRNRFGAVFRASAPITALMIGLLLAAPAFADRAATGALAFHPCTRCHPVDVDSRGKPVKSLPNGMKKHRVELEAHDILGKGDEACLSCHDDPTRNPGRLRMADGTFADVTDTERVSRVCRRCHFEKFHEFEEGIHGKRADKCSAKGCHNPHTPQWIYVAALPPFQGTGYEVKAVGSDRQPFRPFSPPPLPAGISTPRWLIIWSILGCAVSIGVVGFLTVGGRKR